MGVSAIGGSVGPDWAVAQEYVTSILESRDKPGRVDTVDKKPGYSSASSLEGYVLGGAVNKDGELAANVPMMKVADVSRDKYVRESESNYDIYEEVRRRSDKSRILSYNFVQDMFPSIVNSMWGNSGSGLVGNLFGNNGGSGLLDILNNISSLNQNLVDFQNSMDYGRLSEFDYSGYLDKNSSKLRNLADHIVEEYGAVAQDDKAYAVMDWVQKNLEYVSDMDHHGTGEKWSRPIETLQDLLGDCEDGAFLSAGLALHAGIDNDRVRFYGGLVRAGTNAETGGHGWWSYKREKDDEWVVLDWCYLPNQKEIDDRKPMNEDRNYLTDWFVVMGNGLTIDTGAVNTVKDPDALDRWDHYAPGGSGVALGEFRTTGQELRAAQEYIGNSYLKQGLNLPELMHDNNVLLFLSELNKSAGEKGISELQEKIVEDFYSTKIR